MEQDSLAHKTIRGSLRRPRAKWPDRPFPSPPRRHEEKNMMGRRAQTEDHVVNGGDLIQIGLGDGRVDLKLHTRLFHGRDPLHGTGKGAGHAAEGIMTCRIGAVDAHAHPLDTRGQKPFSDIRRDQGPVRRHDHPQALAVAVGGKVEDILAKEGFTARQDDHGVTEGCHIIQQVETGRRVQFTRIGAAERGGPAMGAGEVTAPGYFPGHHT